MPKPQLSVLLAQILFAAGVSGLLAQSPKQLPLSPAGPASLETSTPKGVDARAADNKGRISSRVNLVVLPLTVKDRFGDLVPDLERREVHVFDDNVEQTLSVFVAEAFPLSLAVLIDDDLKPNDARQMAPTLRAIAGGISAEDEALICRFDVEFYPEEKFTGDFATLIDELKLAQDKSGPGRGSSTPEAIAGIDNGQSIHTSSGSGAAAPTAAGGRPTKALDDAVYDAARILQERGTFRRKIMLLISDGTNGTQLNKHKFEETLGELLRDNISVYSVAVGRSMSKRKFARLVEYANHTGGDIYYASKSDAMERLYSEITEEARHEYTLAYTPKGNNRGSAYHAILVRVARPGVTIKTRNGYYSDAPSGSRTAPESGSGDN